MYQFLPSLHVFISIQRIYFAKIVVNSCDFMSNFIFSFSRSLVFSYFQHLTNQTQWYVLYALSYFKHCHWPWSTSNIPYPLCLPPLLAGPVFAVLFVDDLLTCLQPQSSYAKMSSPSKAGQTKNYSHSKLVLKQNNIAPTSIRSSAHL
jgi:hypothetical protein